MAATGWEVCVKHWKTINFQVILPMTLLLLFILVPSSLCLAEGLPKIPAEATARTLDGKTVSISEYKGKLLFLNVWKTDCLPCLVEIPILNRLHQEYSTENFSVIGISMDRGKDELVHRIADKANIAFPVWLGYNQPIAQYVDSGYTPFLVVVGPEGDVLATFLGAIPSYKDAVGFIKQARAIMAEHEAKK